jgi:hypothetical protein
VRPEWRIATDLSLGLRLFISTTVSTSKRASRLFRDCRRAQSLSDPADPLPQSDNTFCLLRSCGRYARGVPRLTTFPMRSPFWWQDRPVKSETLGEEKSRRALPKPPEVSPKNHLEPNSMFLQVLNELHGGFRRIGVTEIRCCAQRTDAGGSAASIRRLDRCLHRFCGDPDDIPFDPQYWRRAVCMQWRYLAIYGREFRRAASGRGGFIPSGTRQCVG